GRGGLATRPALREVPPLRAAGAQRGEPQVLVVSGRHRRRVVPGALHAATGAFVSLLRERRRQDDGAAFLAALGQGRPHVPQRLPWARAPPPPPSPCKQRPQRPTSTSPSCPSLPPS